MPYPQSLPLPMDAFGVELGITPGNRVSVLVPTVLWFGRDRSSNALVSLGGKRIRGYVVSFPFLCPLSFFSFIHCLCICTHLCVFHRLIRPNPIAAPDESADGERCNHELSPFDRLVLCHRNAAACIVAGSAASAIAQRNLASMAEVLYDFLDPE